MRIYITPILITLTIITGCYYQFIYEPTIATPAIITNNDDVYKIRPKFDNTLSAQYSNSFDPLDYKSTLDHRITLAPEPETPMDIYGKTASSQEDQLNKIIAEVKEGVKELSELIILPNSLEKPTINYYNTQTDTSQINENAQIIKRSQIQQQIMVQLASVRSIDQAKKECERIRDKYPKLLEQYKCNHQIISTTQNVYYKVLMSGFNSRFDARKLCKKLRQKKQSCLLLR